MSESEVFGQSLVDRPTVHQDAQDARPRQGFGRRLGRAVVSRAEQAQADHRVEQTRKREALRPAHTRALGLRREAEADVFEARMRLDAALVALLIGDEDESAVEAIEREVEDAERRERRYTAGVRALEQQLGIIRDPAGHILSSGL